MQETTSKPLNGAETVLETLEQVEKRHESAREQSGNRVDRSKTVSRTARKSGVFLYRAQELGTSIPKVRALCETGMIEAEVTPGNQCGSIQRDT